MHPVRGFRACLERALLHFLELATLEVRSTAAHVRRKPQQEERASMDEYRFAIHDGSLGSQKDDSPVTWFLSVAPRASAASTT
ncbi:hypothetical protein Mapa_014246 [Marchantia paleacea]|nr:hypothetical protein Mapa_014246 [Marchantia paleacea]